MRSASPRPWLRRLAIGFVPLVALAACGSDGGDDEAEPDGGTTATTEGEAPEVLTSCSSVTESTDGPENLGAVINRIDFQYCQPDVTVEVGEAVEFINNGAARHQVEQTVEADGAEGFRSDALLSGDEYVFTPDTAGTYEYVCAFHSELMTGVITVE
jgi:plastocyanin